MRAGLLVCDRVAGGHCWASVVAWQTVLVHLVLLAGEMIVLAVGTIVMAPAVACGAGVVVTLVVAVVVVVALVVVVGRRRGLVARGASGGC